MREPSRRVAGQRGASALVITYIGLGWSALGGPMAAWAQTNTARDSADAIESTTTFVPLPAIFYQPETGTGFGAVATYYFRLGAARNVRPSSVSLTAVYTTRKQVITWLQSQWYANGGRLWVIGNLGFSRFPTKFWGVGNDVPESAEEDYTPDIFNSIVEVQREVRTHLYVGLNGQLAHRRLVQTETGGLLDGETIPGSRDGRMFGAGPMLTWDTRDNTVFPRSGGFHQLRATWYDGFFGGDADFGRYSVDVRRYLSLFRSHVVALRGYAVASTGSPPFDYLPQLGGDVLLRGYYQGRYRDRHLLAFQGEYRAPVWSLLGVVLFASAGQVSDDLGGFGPSDFKSAVGGGLRVLLSRGEGLNLRADFAWGLAVESGGFYLSVGEAF